MSEKKIYKVLSRNDTGETKSHQSGISIPKNVIAAGVLPPLGIDKLNPRSVLTFEDVQGEKWEFQYVYYNDVFFGKEPKKGHNEYRLTCVLKFLRKHNIKSGDTIWFSLTDENIRRIGVEYNNLEETNNKKIKKIILGNGWHYFEFKD